MKDYYKILNISQSATQSDIKKSYRALARQYHPDANVGDPKFDKIFADINEAYEILKDEEKRKEYDKGLKQTNEQQTTSHNSSEKKYNQTKSQEFNFSSVNDSFENFFGFNAKTGKVTNEEKLKNKNPLDTTDLFEKFMGFKK